jgi:thiamine-phosphate pyrophosphorylase
VAIIINKSADGRFFSSRWHGLYVLTPDENDTRVLADKVSAVLAGRPALLQYRNKLADRVLKREQAAALVRLCRGAGVALIVNDDLELALEVGADGVHLGREDGDLAYARQALGPGRILGVSCYDEWSRVEAGVAAGADYVALGAMFASATKPQAVRASFDLLEQVRREFAVTVVAIGGITLANVPQIVSAGADLVAVISDVFNADDPGARVRAYGELFIR